MSNSQGKGSFLLKLAIIVLGVAIFIVINVPADIWKQEEFEKNTCQKNMVSIFETHRYYQKIKGHYTTDINNLINTVSQDSALLKRKKVVDHTVRLRDAIDAYFDVEVVKNLLDISMNIRNTENDFNDNTRNFKLFEEFYQESEDLKRELATFRSGVEFENYRITAIDLDSLWQLRRDLTDYSLQNAARRSGVLAKSIGENLPNIDFNIMQQFWTPLSAKISRFLQRVNSNEELKKKTTIADRVADFQDKISDGFNKIKGNNLQSSYTDAEDAANDLNRVYQEFLADFLITEKYAQYNLTEIDSILLYINEDNFYTPIGHQPYIVEFDDSLGINVEDPTLLQEIGNMALIDVEAINQLPFMEAFAAYDKNLDLIQSLSQTIKNTYRRNIDLRIKSKILEESISYLRKTDAFNSYLKLKSFVNKVPSSQSYSEIKVELEGALVSAGSFKARYTDKFFGKLDTAHIDVINQLNEFDQELSTVRRNTFSFNSSTDNLNHALSQIKEISSASVVPALDVIEERLRNVFLDASDGIEKPVYGVFFKRIENHGKVFGRTARRSWED